MPDNQPIDRRRFFRQGLRELLKPLADAAAPIERALNEFESISRTFSSTAPNRKESRHWLRPPGAGEERVFLQQCNRTGVCVSVCPAHAIQLDRSGQRGEGAPFVLPSESPCVLCDGLHCMRSCPSGALTFVPIGEIDMGTAEWHQDLCVRRLGEDCRICVEQCPVGSSALVLDEGKVKVIEAGCTGCGVCEKQCPTSPKSITVKPKSARGLATVSR